jgi:hypothetical protein
VDGGNTGNQIHVYQGGSVSALSKAAITYTGSGNVAVTNDGTVAGSVSLSGSSAPQGVFTNTSIGSLFAEGIINATVDDSGSLFIGTTSSTGATATFLGQYTQHDTGTIVMDVISPLNYDRMQFDGHGNGIFGDEIVVDFSSLYAPTLGDAFLLIGPAASGTNTIYNTWYTSTNNGYVTINGLAAGVGWETRLLSGTYAVVITAVPEPGVVGLGLSGAGLLLLCGRRRMRSLATRESALGDRAIGVGGARSPRGG